MLYVHGERGAWLMQCFLLLLVHHLAVADHCVLLERKKDTNNYVQQQAVWGEDNVHQKGPKRCIPYGGCLVAPNRCPLCE